MKKTYMTPSMLEVRLQHQRLLMQSVTRTQNNVGIGLGGSSSNDPDGVIRSKESSNIWDEEW